MPASEQADLKSPGVDFKLIPASSLVPVPWKNGGGVTRQVAIYPEGASLDSFAWRISAALVEQAGPFSIFKGIDRFIAVTHGVSMTLVDAADQSRRTLLRGQVFAFSGETAFNSELSAGPVQDFNLMVQRGQGRGQLEVRQAAQSLVLHEESVILHCASGEFTVAPASPGGREYRLAAGDSLQITLRSDCRAVVDITPGQDGATLIDARIGPV